MGFGFGAGLVVAPLMFWERGRSWSNNSIEKILLAIFLIFGLVYTHINDDDDDDDEKDEEDEEDTNEEVSIKAEDFNGEDNPEFQGWYCLYCSKLNINWKKVVHDPNCTCHILPSISTSTS
ncbi:hypothetical protein L6164_001166 [Bauhinia variegata]|nr:hypothetical protein L6164_001166 [Bauhinia variegata]